MKSKKLLLSSLFMLGGIACYSILGSNAGGAGAMGAAQSGDGCSCHGGPNTATVITIEGMPAAGYVAGTVYDLTLKITNTSTPTKTKAGFDIYVKSGALSNAPTGTMLMGSKEIHHTTPGTAVAGITSWTFKYTAPATTTDTFKIAGIGADGTGDKNLDDPNFVTLSYTQKPSSVADISSSNFKLYPNPTTSEMNFVSTNQANEVSFKAVSINGAWQNLSSIRKSSTDYSINTSALPSGHYILWVNIDGKQTAQAFSKQ